MTSRSHKERLRVRLHLPYASIVLTIIFSSLASGALKVTSDAITPNSLVYSNDTAENDLAKLCEIVLDLGSPVQPELISFTAFAGFGKSDGSITVGFIVVAGTRASSGELVRTPLSDATFTSRGFRSVDDMEFEVARSGGIMKATVDAARAGNFLGAFAAGDFELRLRLPSKDLLNFAIRSAPPPLQVQDEFGNCVGNLVPHSGSSSNRERAGDDRVEPSGWRSLLFQEAVLDLLENEISQRTLPHPGKPKR